MTACSARPMTAMLQGSRSNPRVNRIATNTPIVGNAMIEKKTAC
jgi:hypothetical protein